MSITLSQDEYATAWRLISSSSHHERNIEDVVVHRVLPGLRDVPTLLDVGAGSGSVSLQLAPHFGAVTLIEQNAAQLSGRREELAARGIQVFDGSFDDFETTERFDVIVCSHVMYHVPRSAWSRFIDRLLGLLRPGGVCIMVLVGGPTDGSGQTLRGSDLEEPLDRTTHSILRRAFSKDAVGIDMLMAELERKHLQFQLVPTINTWGAGTVDEMYAICRFVVYEDCLSPAQVAAMSGDEAVTLDATIREHAVRCLQPDGRYELEMEDGVVLLPAIR